MVGEVMVRTFKSKNKSVELMTSIEGNLVQYDEIDPSELTISRKNKRNKNNFSISITPFRIIAGYYVGFEYTETEINTSKLNEFQMIRFDTWVVYLRIKTTEENEEILHVKLFNRTEEEEGYDEDKYL
jgi:hypothetical protein